MVSCQTYLGHNTIPIQQGLRHLHKSKPTFSDASQHYSNTTRIKTCYFRLMFMSAMCHNTIPIQQGLKSLPYYRGCWHGMSQHYSNTTRIKKISAISAISAGQKENTTVRSPLRHTLPTAFRFQDFVSLRKITPWLQHYSLTYFVPQKLRKLQKKHISLI